MNNRPADNFDALLTILNSLDALVYVSDMQSYELIFVNNYGKSVWGEPKGKKCYQYLQTNQTSPCAFCTNNKLLNAAGEPKEPYVWEFQNTANYNWYQCRDQAVYWPDGRIVRIEIATDITARKQIEQQLIEAKAAAERLANLDDLTQLKNRRAFFNFARPFLAQAIRSGQPLALIMFDVDYFKTINDSFGHAVGDKVLIEIAKLLQRETRSSDIAARLGGEEFAVLLPDTSLQQAEELAERIRQRMAAHIIPVQQQQLKYSASFGISTLTPALYQSSEQPETVLDELLCLADHAMMKAKTQGRNQIVIA
jgi:diguanylate cyclase (GGDEF)-like protein